MLRINQDIGAEQNSLLELNGLLRVFYSWTAAQRKSSKRDEEAEFPTGSAVEIIMSLRCKIARK